MPSGGTMVSHPTHAGAEPQHRFTDGSGANRKSTLTPVDQPKDNETITVTVSDGTNSESDQLLNGGGYWGNIENH